MMHVPLMLAKLAKGSTLVRNGMWRTAAFPESMSMTNVTSKTAALYADLWARLDQPAYELAINESELFYTMPEEVRGKDCLDVGCGSGFFVTRLFRAGAKSVAAMDISAQCVELTRRWNKEWSASLTLAIAGFPKLDFPDNAFDFTHSNGVLHHTEDPRVGFTELCRVTKPGGLTVVGMYGAGGLFPFILNILRSIARHVPYSVCSTVINGVYASPYDQYRALDYLYVPIQRRYTEEEMRDWFTERGYRDIMRTNTHIRYWKRPIWSKFIHGTGYLMMSGRKPL